MLIKNPREDNIIVAQAKKKARVEIHEPPKENEKSEFKSNDVVKTPAYELRKCLSGDDTLMLSGMN